MLSRSELIQVQNSLGRVTCSLGVLIRSSQNIILRQSHLQIFCFCRKNKKDSQNDSNFPQNNISEIRQNFHDPLKLKKTLKSGFLYSLPGQNPNAAGGPGTTERLAFSLFFFKETHVCCIFHRCFWKFHWELLVFWNNACLCVNDDRLSKFVSQLLDQQLKQSASQVCFLLQNHYYIRWKRVLQ